MKIIRYIIGFDLILLLILISLVLYSCAEREMLQESIHRSVKVCADWQCKTNYDIGVMVPEHERRLNAIENELTGVETGCRLEKFVDHKCSGASQCRLNEIASDKVGWWAVKTICEGDTKEVEVYGSIEFRETDDLCGGVTCALYCIYGSVPGSCGCECSPEIDVHQQSE